MASLLPECEWYHIGSAPPSSREPLPQSAPGSSLSSPRPQDELPSTQVLSSVDPGKAIDVSLRPQLAPLPVSRCGGGRDASDACSITTAESASCRDDEAQDDPRASCCGSDAGTTTTPTPDQLQSLLEEQAALAEERHTQMFNLHWSFVHENLQGFSKDIAAMREEFRGMLQRIVTQEVRAPLDAIQQVKLDLQQEVATRCCVDERLERKVTELERGLTEEMRSIRDTLLGMDAAQATGETVCHEPSSLNVSLASEAPIYADKVAALEEKVQKLQRNSSIHVEDKIADERVEWATRMATRMEGWLQSLLVELEKEGEARAAGDQKNALLISQTSETLKQALEGGDQKNALLISQTSKTLKQALEQERQERQCMCSLVAESREKRVVVAKPDGEKDLALNEAFGGVFASVRSLREALGAEAELRESKCQELQKSFQDEIGSFLESTKSGGWHAEAKKIWAVLNQHTHDVQVEATKSSVSPCPRRSFQSALTATWRSQNKKDARPARRLSTGSHSPSRISHSSSLMSLPRSPPRRAGLDSDFPLPRSSPPCIDESDVTTFIEFGEQPPPPSKSTQPA